MEQALQPLHYCCSESIMAGLPTEAQFSFMYVISSQTLPVLSGLWAPLCQLFLAKSEPSFYLSASPAALVPEFLSQVQCEQGQGKFSPPCCSISISERCDSLLFQDHSAIGCSDNTVPRRTSRHQRQCSQYGAQRPFAEKEVYGLGVGCTELILNKPLNDCDSQIRDEEERS